MIPYGHQSINPEDIEAVVKVLQTDWISQGPKVNEFEKALADYCGSNFAVVVCNGTAALHAAYFAAGLSKGDEFITSPITFAATSNAGLWQGAKSVFVDIEEETGNIDADLIERAITKKTKVIVPIDYTGRPADLEKINQIAKKYSLIVVEDACQALGAEYNGKKSGALSDLTVFSFHPVKTITTGEGGAVLTNNEKFYQKLKLFINHGINKKEFIKKPEGGWYCEMQELGMNYRLTDFQCALGINQLKRVEKFMARRCIIAQRYFKAFKDLKSIILPPTDTPSIKSAWHLYVIRLRDQLIGKRAELFKKLRERGIGVQVHHLPVYHHPYYQKLGYKKSLCPKSEKFYNSIISLPIYPTLSLKEQEYIIRQVKIFFAQL